MPEKPIGGVRTRYQHRLRYDAVIWPIGAQVSEPLRHSIDGNSLRSTLKRALLR